MAKKVIKKEEVKKTVTKKPVKKEEVKKAVAKKTAKKEDKPNVRIIERVVTKINVDVPVKTLPERIDEIKNRVNIEEIIGAKEEVAVEEVKQEAPVVEVKPEPTWQEIHDAEILAKVAREK